MCHFCQGSLLLKADVQVMRQQLQLAACLSAATSPVWLATSMPHVWAASKHSRLGSSSAGVSTASMLLQVEAQELILKPGDSEVQRLQLRPLQPGVLRLTGLEWVLNGHAHGQLVFPPPEPRQHRQTDSRQVPEC